ncbi:hypothetical protein B0H13DRAFT_2090271, partial [Mycena leptocephala]
MDNKIPQPADLPAPASHTEPSRPQCCKTGRLVRLLGFSALLLWVGARYLRVAGPMTFHQLDEEYLDASKVCLLKRDNDQTGVGIFTKWEGEEGHHEHRKLRFNVTVTLPRTEDGSALAINRFLTDLEIYSQTFADMSNIAFDKLYLKSALGGVHAESLYAGNATITATIGPIKLQSLVAKDVSITSSIYPIEGTFNVSGTLALTSFGGINVDVNLSADDDNAAKPQIHADNDLLSKASGAFDIAARTSYGPLRVAVLSAPVNSNITLQATSTLGAADVSMPPTYEGSFNAYTSLSSITVNMDEKAEDPAGEGRTRRMEFDQAGRGMMTGRVGWSDEGMGRGSVDVRTSMASVKL